MSVGHCPLEIISNFFHYWHINEILIIINSQNQVFLFYYICDLQTCVQLTKKCQRERYITTFAPVIAKRKRFTNKQIFKMPKGLSESVNRRRTDNIMAKRKMTKWSTNHIYKIKDRVNLVISSSRIRYAWLIVIVGWLTSSGKSTKR